MAESYKDAPLQAAVYLVWAINQLLLLEQNPLNWLILFTWSKKLLVLKYNLSQQHIVKNKTPKATPKEQSSIPGYN